MRTSLSSVEQLHLFFIEAVRRSKLRRPPGMGYRDAAAACLKIPVSECRRLQQHGAYCSRAHRMGFRVADFALKQRGSLEDLPPFNELVIGVDYDRLLEWMAKHHRDELIQRHRDLHRPSGRDVLLDS